MASHTIVAVFDTPAHAELAVADLTRAGVPASSIQHYSQNTASEITRADSGSTGSGGGFWAWLTGEETASHDHTLYTRSIDVGRTVVTVVTGDEDSDRIASILEEHGPIELNEDGGAYAESGTGAAGISAGGTAAAGSYTGGSYAGVTAGTGREAGSAVGATAGKEEVIAFSEEELQVGKRVVQGGTTRVRRYVVERPAEEQVRLRDETVRVFRSPVSGAAGADSSPTRSSR